MPEVALAAEVLPVWVLAPALDHVLVAERVHVLEVEQRSHQPGWQCRPPRRGLELRAPLLRKRRPVDQFVDHLCRLLSHFHECAHSVILANVLSQLRLPFFVELPHLDQGLLTLAILILIRFVWSMISYGSGLPGGIFLPILTLGSLLGLFVARFFLDIGFISQDQMLLFIVLGMAGFFSAISKAPLTAIILVIEMVGSLNQLMVIGLVALSSYVIMDILGGAPVYEAMLEKILPEEVEQQEHMTLIEVVVNETLDQTFVSELRLPDSCLITSQIHHGKSRIVKGNSQLFMGDSLLVAVPISQIHTVRKILEGA